MTRGSGRPCACAPRRLPPCGDGRPGARAGASPGRGRSAAIASASAAAACFAKRARRSSGPVRIRARARLMAWVRSLRALRLATISARIASTAPSRPFGAPLARPDCAARAALSGTTEAGDNLAIADRLVAGLAPARGLRVADSHRAGDRAAELAEHRVQVRRVADAAALGEPLTLAPL